MSYQELMSLINISAVVKYVNFVWVLLNSRIKDLN